MNRLTHTLWSSLLQWMILLYVIMLLPLSVYSQTYSWKQVAPFPYYRAEHVLHGNGISFVSGRIIDSVDVANSPMREIGATPFFVISSDDKTWKQINPKAVNPAATTDGAGKQEEAIIPLKTLFVQNSFVTLAQNTDGQKKIYYSDNGRTWYETGIYASSLHYIYDRLFVEHDLTFSVSFDGKKWDTYGTVIPTGLDTANYKSIPNKNRTISIIAIDPSSVSFSGDSVYGYYVDSSYVLTDNDRTIGVSRDGITWRVVQRPLLKVAKDKYGEYQDYNGDYINNLTGVMYGNNQFVYVTKNASKYGFSYSSSDGKSWKRTQIDTINPGKEFDPYLPPLSFQQLFFQDSLFFITRITDRINTRTTGMIRTTMQYISRDGMSWQRYDAPVGRDHYMEYPHEKLPGETIPEKFASQDIGFRLSPEGQFETVPTEDLFGIRFCKNQFRITVESSKVDYCSNDGYTWQYEKYYIDSLCYSSDPYYKENHTFVELNSVYKEIPPDDASCGSVDNEPGPYRTEDGHTYSDSYFVTISKDGKIWDTINVDSLMKCHGIQVYLKKFSDCLTLTTVQRNSGNWDWFSTDGRRWSALGLKSTLDSCYLLGDLNAAGKDQKIYIYSTGETKLSNDFGTQWFPVINQCKRAHAVTWGNGYFVAAGENGKIWVLEKNK